MRYARPVLLLTMVSAVLFSACAPSSEPNSLDAATQALVDSARAIVEAEVASARLPGLSIAVAVDGEVVWAEGFGLADVESGTPVTTASKFRVGSVSKPYTATAIAQLMTEGKLDVDAPIQTYVPGFPEKAWTISTRQVGGHIAGIRHYEGDENLSAVEYPTVESGLAIFKDSPLLFEPGTRYAYSSYGWNLISAVVEGASGQDFLTYMDDHVFGPLEMTDTEADWATRDIADRVSFYVRDESGSPVSAPYVDNSYKWAGGGFLSTPLDMIRFAEAHRSPGFLTQDALDFLQTSQRLDDGSSTGYGFGWTTGEDNAGRRLVGHTGGSVGGTTLLTMNPDTGIIVAMAINLSGADLTVGRRIMQHFLDAQASE